MHGGGLQGYEDPADLRRSASQDPDHLFANPMFMDRCVCVGFDIVLLVLSS